MNEWGVAEFVSRFARNVTIAGEGLAAQLAERTTGEEIPGASFLAYTFPMVDPSPDFVMALRQQLMEAPIIIEDVSPLRSPFADRRVVYGVAAFGSIASAAVVVAYLLRSRGVSRLAA